MVQTSILFQRSQMSQHGFPGVPPSAADNRLTRGSENLRAVTLSSVLGAVIEWCDFFLYGVAHASAAGRFDCDERSGADVRENRHRSVAWARA
jgi:hypothetical protein